MVIQPVRFRFKSDMNLLLRCNVSKVLQAGQILLQTAPDHIDVKRLESQLKKTFPMIVNVHDFHVWALTPGRVISTVHLVFLCEAVKILTDLIYLLHSYPLLSS